SLPASHLPGRGAASGVRLDPRHRRSLRPQQPGTRGGAGTGADPARRGLDRRLGGARHPRQPAQPAAGSLHQPHTPPALAAPRRLLRVSSNSPGGSAMTCPRAARIGPFYTFGEDRLPINDLFKAGGANTVRGFGTDALGPQTIGGEALGGGATLIFNEEFRYQHPSGLGAAVFYDAGNVYPRLQDFNFGLRHSIGFGVRYSAGFGLIRIDFAVPLNKRPEDKGYQLWFGFGQIF